MKLKKFALVMVMGAAACAAPAVNADVNTTDYSTTNAPPNPHEVTLHLTGSSSIRDTFQRMMNRYCNTNIVGGFPYNVYVSGSAQNFRAYECTLHTTISNGTVGPEIDAKGLAGKRVLVYHTVEVNSALGGSITGVMPVFRGIPMQFVTVGTACPVTTPAGANPFSTRTCAAAARHARLPNAGASDCEPGFCTGINLAGVDVVVMTNPILPSLATQGRVNQWKSSITANEISLGNIKPMFALGFGIAATRFAKDAGLTNLSHSQVASVLAGNVEDWSQISSTLSGPVKICRRTQGSGTQAAFNAMFNFNPCLTGKQAALPVATAPGAGGLTVVESSTTSGVKACLTAADAANPREIAIGLLSLENNEVVAGWEFIAINGVNPFLASEPVVPPDGVPDRILENVIANGSYPFYQEPTMQWYKPGVSGNGVCVDDPESVIANDAPHAAVLPFCDAGEIHLAPTSSNGNTGVVPSGDLLKLVELIRDNASNPEITKNTMLTYNLPGVLSLPFWWTQAPYSGFRITPDELSQGIHNYTRNGQCCPAE